MAWDAGGGLWWAANLADLSLQAVSEGPTS